MAQKYTVDGGVGWSSEMPWFLALHITTATLFRNFETAVRHCFLAGQKLGMQVPPGYTLVADALGGALTLGLSVNHNDSMAGALVALPRCVHLCEEGST